MSRSAPDGGYQVSSDPTTQVNDFGELSNHLLMGGGANSRSGRWLWATGFESGLAELSSKIYATQDKTVAYQGAASAKLQTVAVNNSLDAITKTLFTPFNETAENKRIGQEFLFTFDQTGGQPQEIFAQSISKYAFAVRLYLSAFNVGDLYIRTPPGPFTWTPIVNVNTYVSITPTPIFHYIKLVGDFETGKYVKVVFDNLVIDLSGYDAFLIGTTPLAISNEINLRTLAGVARSSNIDNWILTGDEP